MEFRQIEAFIAVSEHESFSRAGAAMHLTQSAISQLIRRLEDEIGAKLFIRHGRSVKLSHTGIDLLPTAFEIIRHRNSFIERISPRPEEVSGQLHVGANSMAAALVWARMFQAFTDTYPKIELYVRSNHQPHMTTELLLNGELDVGTLPFPVPHVRLDGQIVGHHEAVLVASPDHPLASKSRITTKDLATNRFILYEPRMNLRTLSDLYFQELNISPPVILQSSDTALIRALVEIGYGIAFLPDWAIERELSEKRLVTLKSPGLRLYEEFGVMYLKQMVRPVAQEFIRFCTTHVELLPSMAQGPILR